MKKFTLLPYQKRVGELILKGKNVILQAPTGAGKTYAALYPLSYALREGRNFPGKCLYSVPMRVLANQFVEDYRDMVTPGDFLDRRTETPVSIQTGEHRDDPRLEAILTFATIDQTLSSFLVAPYSLSRREANLNVGAVVSSYLIFDEFHLFDSDSTLPTTLEMLKMVSGVTRFILMTATFTTPLLSELARMLNAEVVGGTAEEIAAFAELPSQQKVRRYHTVSDPLDADTVLRQHRGQTLVICNQVERTQALFESIRDQARQQLPDTKVLLLHSRMLREDRAKVEATLREALSKERYSQANLIVVSTQAIEVGVDINSTVLHTELAPANSLVQRAGRCARYAGTEGDVYIYRTTRNEFGEPMDLIEDYLPYQGQQEVIKLTWEAFSNEQGVLDYVGEHRILNHAHSASDQALCDALATKQSSHREAMVEVMAGRDPGNVSRLVRDIFTQSILIHDQPETLLDSEIAPYAIEGISLQPGTVAKYVKEWLDRSLPDEPPFRVKGLIEQPNPEQSRRAVYDWVSVTEARHLTGFAMFVVHPSLAGYDPVLGFLPHTGSAYRSTLPPITSIPEGGRSYGYRLESYERHIELVMEQFKTVWVPMEKTAARLESLYEWPKGSILHAARLAVVLHDTGKLSTGWQEAVRDWQTFIGETAQLEAGRAYAHTDNYTPQHWALAKAFKGKKRPPHAGEGAIAVLPTLYDALCDAAGKPIGTLIHATFTAIACHHTPHISEVGTFKLIPGALDLTQRLLRHYFSGATPPLVKFPDVEQQKDVQLDEFLAAPSVALHSEEHKAFLVYTLLVRALRLSDQKGTGAGTFKG
jgi:CRISPR-associated endonuclease/helicase Cas3